MASWCLIINWHIHGDLQVYQTVHVGVGEAQGRSWSAWYFSPDATNRDMDQADKHVIRLARCLKLAKIINSRSKGVVDVPFFWIWKDTKSWMFLGCSVATDRGKNPKEKTQKEFCSLKTCFISMWFPKWESFNTNGQIISGTARGPGKCALALGNNEPCRWVGLRLIIDSGKPMLKSE